tara:strand:+ start:795 stop:1409 length:615 start_codon:yes stop_codon:yes gene_type:complete
MKLIFENWKKFLNESSLSRVYQHIAEHDAAIISASRNDIFNTEKCTDRALGAEPGDTNMLRSRNLKAMLLSMGYGVTKMRGSYIEDFDTPQAVEVGEDSLFVVNLSDQENFFNQIISLGEKFCQDSVLLIPRGGVGAFLHGTNKSEFPGYGDRIVVGNLKLGEEEEFMTRTQGRPFTFTEQLQTYRGLSRNERIAVKSIAKKLL